MSKKYLVGVAAIVVFVVVICVAAQVRPNQLDRGGEWLAWSPAERATFVQGFMSGYRQGTHGACDVAQELFGEPGKMYRLGDENRPSEIPSARCLARMDEYSKAKYTEVSGLDVTAYTDVITEFYTKHPEYQGIAFVNLLGSLSDRNYKTAERLYEMAVKGEIRPLR